MKRGKAHDARASAKRLRFVVYQGNPCRNGHGDGIRYTANARCVQCAVGDALKQNEKRKVDRKAAKRKTNY